MPKQLFSSSASLAVANWTKECSPWEWPHRDGSSSCVSPILAPMALCDTKTQSCECENQGVVEVSQDSAQVAVERGIGTRLVLGDNADLASHIYDYPSMQPRPVVCSVCCCPYASPDAWIWVQSLTREPFKQCDIFGIDWGIIARNSGVDIREWEKLRRNFAGIVFK